MANQKNYTAEKKAQIVIEAIEGVTSISQIGAREGISPKLISNWKREFSRNAYRAFSTSKDEKAAEEREKAATEKENMLLAKIGQLTYELDWIKKKSDEVISRRKKADG